MSKNITHDELNDNENDGGSIFRPYNQDVTKYFPSINKAGE